jgi:hypothetical protein
MRLNRILLAAALLAGCAFRDQVPSGVVACAQNGHCPSGLTCFHGSPFPQGLCCSDQSCDGLMTSPDPVAPVVPPEEDAAVDSLAVGVVVVPDQHLDAPVAPPAPTVACDRLATTACGQGQACRPACEQGVASTRCEPTGTGMRNESCSRGADCAAGLTCSVPACSTAHTGQCRLLCRTDSDCGTAGICLGASCGMRDDAYRVCSSACDPRPGAPATCPGGSSCLLLGRDATDCQCPQAANAVDEGGTCDDNLRCKAELVCTPEGKGRVCRPICRLNAPTTCPLGRRCVALPGYEIYGACAPVTDPQVQACSPTAVGACGGGRSCRLTCVGSSLTTSCNMATASHGANELCDNDTDCADGLECVAASCPNGQDITYCEPFCRTDADCSGHSWCIPEICDNDAATPFGVCTGNCDPVGKTNGCAPGLVCALYAFDRTDCMCRAGGTLHRDGETCSPALAGEDCQPGLMCLTRGTTSKCRPICRIAAKDCAADRTCAVLPDHSVYGACIPNRGDVPFSCDPAVAASCPGGASCVVACKEKDVHPSVSCQPAGAREVGQTCIETRDCVPGSACLTRCPKSSDVSVCSRYCKSDAECGGGTSKCGLDQCSGVSIPFAACSSDCDPRGPATSGCVEGLECRLLPGDKTDCLCVSPPKPGGTDGEPCTDYRDCLPGNTCVFETTRWSCRPICRVDAPGTCPTGRVCTALPDQRTYGACRQ